MRMRPMETRCRVVGLILVVLMLPIAATGRSNDQHYEIGIVVSMAIWQGKLPVPIGPRDVTVQVPTPKKYKFIVEGTGVAYEASCWARKTDYRPEWNPRDKIEYRVEKDQILVRRQKGREQPLLVELRGESSEAMTIVGTGKKVVPECL